MSLYNLLGVERNATDQEIKRAYRRVALRMHPDINPDPDANSLFAEVNIAYETLIDPNKRSRYDYLLEHGRRPPKPKTGKRYRSRPGGTSYAQSRAEANRYDPRVMKSFFVTMLFLGFVFMTIPVRAVITGLWDAIFIFVAAPGFILVRDAWNVLARVK